MPGTVAYRIDPREPVDQEVRRILREQLDEAVAVLRAPGGPDASGIHDSRRRIKKARSLLRLSRSLLGPAVVRQANAELREASASIARQRDADARVEALDRILAGDVEDDADRAAVERLRQRCADAADAQRAAGSVDASTAHGTARQLQQTRDWLQRVPARSEGWDALGPGLRRQYGRGRAQLRRLGEQPSDDERHDWRKRAKDLWYHERLLRDLWPKAQKPYLQAASDLADLLGDDHDLSAVSAFADQDRALAEEDRAAVCHLIGDRRGSLLAEARSLGRLLYADRPRAWADRHEAWWEISIDGPARSS